MRLNFRYITTLLTAAPLLCGCSGENPQEPARAFPVIEGWINTGTGPDVVLTQSVDPARETSISDAMVTWAKVTVSDGEEEVILTCGYNSAYSPPYHYYSHALIGTPGKTYTVRAETSEYTAVAVSTMPQPTPIDRVTSAPLDGDSCDRAPTLWFTAPEDVPAYYYVSLAPADGSVRPLPAMLGTAMAVKAGTEIGIPVFNPRNRLDGDYKANFRSGDNILVTLNRIDRQAYDFWVAYDNALSFGSNLFIGTDTDIPTGIDGGLGVWSAQGSSTLLYRVP